MTLVGGVCEDGRCGADVVDGLIELRSWCGIDPLGIEFRSWE